MIDKASKARKACWVYECKPCGVVASYPDRFRAVERQQNHRAQIGHLIGAVYGAFGEAIDAVAKGMTAFARAFEAGGR